MHGIKTIHRLHQEACEAQRILSAHAPAHLADSHPEIDQAIREQRAKAQETITKITAPTH
jgi:hypothetical protein